MANLLRTLPSSKSDIASAHNCGTTAASSTLQRQSLFDLGLAQRHSAGCPGAGAAGVSQAMCRRRVAQCGREAEDHLRIARATYSWHVSQQADTLLRHDKPMSSCVATNSFLLRHDWPDGKTRNGYGVPCISRATSSGLRLGSNLVLSNFSPSIDTTSQITGITSHITGSVIGSPHATTTQHVGTPRGIPIATCLCLARTKRAFRQSRVVL